MAEPTCSRQGLLSAAIVSYGESRGWTVVLAITPMPGLPQACPPACDGLRGGCEQCARTWVADHRDDDNLDVDELRAAFLGIYAREPDEEDEAVGLWSLVCAGAAADA